MDGRSNIKPIINSSLSEEDNLEEKDYSPPSLILYNPSIPTNKLTASQRIGADTISKYIYQNFPQYKHTQISDMMGFETAKYISEYTEEVGENYIRRTIPFSSRVRVLHCDEEDYAGFILSAENVLNPDGTTFYKIYANRGIISEIKMYFRINGFTVLFEFYPQFNTIHGYNRLSITYYDEDVIFSCTNRYSMFGLERYNPETDTNILKVLEEIDPDLYYFIDIHTAVIRHNSPIGFNGGNYTLEQLAPILYSVEDSVLNNRDRLELALRDFYKTYDIYNEFLNNSLVNFTKVKISFNNDGFIHSFNGKPAVEFIDLTTDSVIGTIWYKDGIIHRENGPAYMEFDVFGGIKSIKFYINGVSLGEGAAQRR